VGDDERGRGTCGRGKAAKDLKDGAAARAQSAGNPEPRDNGLDRLIAISNA